MPCEENTIEKAYNDGEDDDSVPPEDLLCEGVHEDWVDVNARHK
jgi:hypothetical protein